MVLREAAVRGLGIARIPAVLVSEAIHEGQLVPLLDAYAPPATPLHLVYVGGRHVAPRTRAFIELVRQRLTREFTEALP